MDCFCRFLSLPPTIDIAKTKKLFLAFMKRILTNDVWPPFSSLELVKLSGELLTMRDATLKVIFSEGEDQDFLKGKVIYFCGPTPTPPGKIIGSCGPTTSSRMEPFFEQLTQAGVKGIIGKGQISEESEKILREGSVVYFSAVGGTGALLSSKVKSSKILKYTELGPEAVYRLEVENFPVVVVS